MGWRSGASVQVAAGDRLRRVVLLLARLLRASSTPLHSLRASATVSPSVATMSAPRPLRALRPLLLAALIALSVSRATDASAADRASKIADRLVKQLDDEELGALVGLLTDACES